MHGRASHAASTVDLHPDTFVELLKEDRLLGWSGAWTVVDSLDVFLGLPADFTPSGMDTAAARRLLSTCAGDIAAATVSANTRLRAAFPAPWARSG
jgi:hypothetical protein